MMACEHDCCLKLMKARHDIRLTERLHTHVHEPNDCPSCWIAGRKIPT